MGSDAVGGRPDGVARCGWMHCATASLRAAAQSWAFDEVHDSGSCVLGVATLVWLWWAVAARIGVVMCCGHIRTEEGHALEEGGD